MSNRQDDNWRELEDEPVSFEEDDSGPSELDEEKGLDKLDRLKSLHEPQALDLEDQPGFGFR